MRSPLLSQEYFSVRRREDVREAVAGTRKPGNHFVVEHETGACSESFSHTILNHTSSQVAPRTGFSRLCPRQVSRGSGMNSDGVGSGHCERNWQ